MKKLILFLLFFTLSLHANQEDLNKAIIKSDLAQVKELLKTTKLSKEEIFIFSNLSQNIMSERYIDKTFAHIPAVLFGSISHLLSVITVYGINRFYSLGYENIKPSWVFQLGMCSSLSTLLGYGAYKLLKSPRIWHNNAKYIHELLKSQTI